MSKIRQAVILAGGKGMRLRPLTKSLPKPMISFRGKPFLEHLIDLLKKNSITEVLILTGYLHEKIEDYFGDGKRFGLKIIYYHSPISDNTGTRLRKAKKYIQDEFLLLYSDNYWPLNLDKLYDYYQRKKKMALVTLYSNKDKYTKNNMYVDGRGLVKLYDKTNSDPNLNAVDIGFFILNKKIIDYIPKINLSFENIVLPKLIKEKQLSGHLTHHKYYGLSNLKRIPEIEKFFEEKKVVFLDRDGVINKKVPKAQYITSWSEFVFLPRVKVAFEILSKKGYLVFIVSNQAGIARGVMSRKQVDQINQKMKKKLDPQETMIKDIYICPHGWDEGCFCRKPAPGLFFQAASDHAINLFESYCIGDDRRDIIAGKTAGCKTFLITKTRDLYDVVQKNL